MPGGVSAFLWIFSYICIAYTNHFTMLRYLRILTALAVFACFIALFAGVDTAVARRLAFLPSWQFIPAIMAVNIPVLAALVVLTLLLGRIYCSVLCPLGIWQDAVNTLANRLTSKKKRKLGRRHHSAPWTKTRTAFFGVFALLLVLGFFTSAGLWMAGILEPYSIFGRVASSASLATRAAASSAIIPVVAVGTLSFVIVSVMAWRSGRLYCNTVCPTGFMLGCLSRYSLLKITIDTDRCNRCGSCARHCKAECIDPKAHAIDYSRCVMCMDCIDECSQSAIALRPIRMTRKNAREGVGVKTSEANGHDAGRRSFIIAGALATGALASLAAEKTTDGGLAPIKMKKASPRLIPLSPAGSRGADALASRCTACQLCITNCPNHVLRPSVSADRLMQPVMSYESGWCRPECTVCSHLCPDGAIVPVTREEKTAIKIGNAVVDTDTCISAAYGQTCGNCARHCPAGAIRMLAVPGYQGPVPTVDENACIGCGSCEYHCPVGRAGQIPGEVPAIHVEGIERHRKI